MIDKSPFTINEVRVTRVNAHGSSLRTAGDDSLDNERAASMADEGGCAGALTDALEQAGDTLRELPTQAARQRSNWLPWAAAGVGLAAAWLFWVRRN